MSAEEHRAAETLSDALAEAYPSVAPEIEGEEGQSGEEIELEIDASDNGSRP